MLGPVPAYVLVGLKDPVGFSVYRKLLIELFICYVHRVSQPASSRDKHLAVVLVWHLVRVVYVNADYWHTRT